MSWPLWAGEMVEELNSSPGDENTSRVPEIHQGGQGSWGGREAEREERRTSTVIAVVNKLISVRQIPLLTVTSLLQGADPGMGGLVRGACAPRTLMALGVGALSPTAKRCGLMGLFPRPG